jgi:hypothetical protein
MGYTTNWGNVTVMWNMTITIDKRQKKTINSRARGSIFSNNGGALKMIQFVMFNGDTNGFGVPLLQETPRKSLAQKEQELVWIIKMTIQICLCVRLLFLDDLEGKKVSCLRCIESNTIGSRNSVMKQTWRCSKNRPVVFPGFPLTSDIQFVLSKYSTVQKQYPLDWTNSQYP